MPGTYLTAHTVLNGISLSKYRRRIDLFQKQMEDMLVQILFPHVPSSLLGNRATFAQEMLRVVLILVASRGIHSQCLGIVKPMEVTVTVGY